MLKARGCKREAVAANTKARDGRLDKTKQYKDRSLEWFAVVNQKKRGLREMGGSVQSGTSTSIVRIRRGASVKCEQKRKKRRNVTLINYESCSFLS